jgi:hypothetical protein
VPRIGLAVILVLAAIALSGCVVIESETAQQLDTVGDA